MHHIILELISVVRGSQWPFSLIIQVGNEHCTYAPKSDFLVTKDLLPRLLVEVNSESQRIAPPDCNCMLAQGAFIVRYANSFISDYSGDKNFTLVAVFFRRDGVAERYVLFQRSSQLAPLTSANQVFVNVLRIKHVLTESYEVYHNMKRFTLTDRIERLQFALELYNLASALRHEATDNMTNGALLQLLNAIDDYKKGHNLKTFRSTNETKGKGKRTRSDTGEGGQSGDAQRPGDSGSVANELKAQGYEIVPDSFVDERGGLWETLTPVRPRNCFICEDLALIFVGSCHPMFTQYIGCLTRARRS